MLFMRNLGCQQVTVMRWSPTRAYFDGRTADVINILHLKGCLKGEGI